MSIIPRDFFKQQCATRWRWVWFTVMSISLERFFKGLGSNGNILKICVLWLCKTSHCSRHVWFWLVVHLKVHPGWVKIVDLWGKWSIVNSHVDEEGRREDENLLDRLWFWLRLIIKLTLMNKGMMTIVKWWKLQKRCWRWQDVDEPLWRGWYSGCSRWRSCLHLSKSPWSSPSTSWLSLPPSLLQSLRVWWFAKVWWMFWRWFQDFSRVSEVISWTPPRLPRHRWRGRERRRRGQSGTLDLGSSEPGSQHWGITWLASNLSWAPLLDIQNRSIRSKCASENL